MTSNFAILGGTFNPIHIGHLRIALEVVEALKLDYCDLLPAYSPPHKNTNVLPYDFRLELLRLAIENNSKLKINTIESRLPTPSYTFFTLNALAQENKKPYFIIGLQDFKQINNWKNGLEIVKNNNLVVVTRTNSNVDEFNNTVYNFFKEVNYVDNIAQIGKNGTCQYLDLTSLNISSSGIRNLWLKKQDFRYLVPDTCYHFLKENEKILKKHW